MLLHSYASEAEASPAENSVTKGKDIYEQTCVRCHTIGGGRSVGPDLLGVTRRRERGWLVNWISDPEGMVVSGDPIAKELAAEYENVYMPDYGLTKGEISDVLDFLASREEQLPGTAPVLYQSEGKGKEIFVSSDTYLQCFEDARGEGHSPVYEHFAFQFRDREKRWSFSSSGWLRYDLGALSLGERRTEELTYAFLRYAPFTERQFQLSLGRLFVFEGVASEQIDGISSHWEFTEFNGLSFFGGVTVEKDIDGGEGNFIYGARIFQRIARKAEAGISFLQERNDGTPYRGELGVDLWILPFKKIEFQGHSFYNTKTEGWMEHSYMLRLLLSGKLTLSGLLLHANYTDAFSSSTINLFSPDFLGKEEALTKISGSAEYRLSRRTAIVLEVIGYGYNESGDAMYYGARVTKNRYGFSSGLSLHRMEGDTERLRYIDTRIYASRIFNNATISLEGTYLHYDQRFEGFSRAYTINGTAEYRLTDALRAGISVNYSRNPDFDDETRLLLTLAYNLHQSRR